MKAIFSTIIFSCLTMVANANITVSECSYLPASQPKAENDFFHQLIVRGHQADETFDSILAYVEANKTSYPQFYYQLPLKNEEHAQSFTEVMRFKAQAAHNFVPVIETCQVTGSTHLGFTRQITIVGNGPTVQEHALIDQNAPQVIFIEEWSSLDGVWSRGGFAAINRVEEIDGNWYFTGNYLYPEVPTEEEIVERIDVFIKTYENMLEQA